LFRKGGTSYTALYIPREKILTPTYNNPFDGKFEKKMFFGNKLFMSSSFNQKIILYLINYQGKTKCLF
jgi:hypothetical protein